MPKVVIIDYGSGNLHSALKAVQHVSDGNAALVTNPNALKEASHIILPGVGAFADCHQGLHAIDGMRDALEEEVQQKEKPFLGICVGMQLLAKKGYENGQHDGLGWIDGEVKPISSSDSTLAIPHMGWNVLNTSEHPLLNGLGEEPHAYFVHSYCMKEVESATIATADYAETLTAVVAKENVMGTQFHPEKSQTVGLRILKNFVTL